MARQDTQQDGGPLDRGPAEEIGATAQQAGRSAAAEDSGAGELPPRDDEPPERPDGNNATIHHPDPRAEEHPAREAPRERGPYVTGNY